MELYEFKNKVLELLNVEIEKLSDALMAKALSDDYLFFDNLKSLHDNLATDHLQPIFQYYMADRKEKMQDYTPSCLGNLIARLNHIEQARSCYDMCAGSGSLTIQAWNINHGCVFYCEEYDERVIPFLLCNLKLRNIHGYVIHGDVLSKERFKAWRLAKGKVYSTVFELSEPPLEIKTDCCISNPPYNIKWEPPVFAQLDSRFAEYGVPPKSNANYAFVLNALHIAESSALILPNSIMEERGEIVEQLIVNNKIDGLILNPNKMFEATDISTCVLSLKKTRATTAVEMVDCRNKNHTESSREQRGQFGGTSHTNRVYTKTVNEYSENDIDKLVKLVDSKGCESELAKAVFPDVIKTNKYRLSPSLYIDIVFEEPRHRDYAEIMRDINRIRRNKNACKLVINETKARQMGFDVSLYNSDLNDDMGDTDKLMQKLCGQAFEKPDYIQFTKNKNEFILKANSKEEFPELLLLAFKMWKQRVMMLNNDENILLAELRDALLPDLMSGKIEI